MIRVLWCPGMDVLRATLTSSVPSPSRFLSLILSLILLFNALSLETRFAVRLCRSPQFSSWRAPWEICDQCDDCHIRSKELDSRDPLLDFLILAWPPLYQHLGAALSDGSLYFFGDMGGSRCPHPGPIPQQPQGCLRRTGTGRLLADFAPCHIPGCEINSQSPGEMTWVCLFFSCLHFKGSTGKNNTLMNSSSSLLDPEQEIGPPLSEVSSEGRGVEGLSSSGWPLAPTDLLFCGVSYNVTCS